MGHSLCGIFAFPGECRVAPRRAAGRHVLQRAQISRGAPPRGTPRPLKPSSRLRGALEPWRA
ncbi:hypothetical protein M885DRAFT_5110 [Pelagophyceae sp. CCMP2097]|nr:hypothetical protein M885DRAFT_5110 [Pelagophyceae sp. CCMP2097]